MPGTRSLDHTLSRLQSFGSCAVVDPGPELRAALPAGPVISAARWRKALSRSRHWDVVVCRWCDDLRAEGAPLEAALKACKVALLFSAHAIAPPPAAKGRLLREARLARRGGADVHTWLLRGDRADPVVRIDDYPTGIRPVLADLAPIHDVLMEFETRGLEVHLGIVPALLDARMIAFLRTLRGLVPLAHGYDHAYPRLSTLLEQRDDPFNQRGTVRAFNEFRGQTRAQIAAKLAQGRAIIEDALGLPVRGYIPPCNRADRTTGHALEDAGYAYYMSERKIFFCDLPLVRSDFYGRSPEYPAEEAPAVVSLHATWEADVRRGGDRASLPRLVDALVQHKARQRAAVQRLAEEALAA